MADLRLTVLAVIVGGVIAVAYPPLPRPKPETPPPVVVKEPVKAPTVEEQVRINQLEIRKVQKDIDSLQTTFDRVEQKLDQKLKEKGNELDNKGPS